MFDSLFSFFFITVIFTIKFNRKSNDKWNTFNIILKKVDYCKYLFPFMYDTSLHLPSIKIMTITSHHMNEN